MQDSARFLAILSNGSEELVGLRSGCLCFERWDLEAVTSLVCAFTDLPEYEAYSQLTNGYFCTDEDDRHVFVATGVLDPATAEPRDDSLSALAASVGGVYEAALAEIDHTCAALRFLSGRPITCAMAYLYDEAEPGPFQAARTSTRRPQAYMPFVTEAPTPDDLSRLIGSYPTPRAGSSVHAALESFQQSFSVSETGMALVHLIVSLEALLNPGQHELKYRVSRNLAVLIGRSRAESDALFCSVRKFYDMRSKLLHAGSAPSLTWEGVIELRTVVARAIQAAEATGLSKDALCGELTRRGFGDFPTANPPNKGLDLTR